MTLSKAIESARGGDLRDLGRGWAGIWGDVDPLYSFSPTTPWSSLGWAGITKV